VLLANCRTDRCGDAFLQPTKGGGGGGGARGGGGKEGRMRATKGRLKNLRVAEGKE